MRFIFFATLLVAIPGVASAEPLSFDEALERAAAQAPSLRARALEIDARRSAATAAGQLPDPKLGVGLDNFPVSGPPAGSFAEDSMTMAPVSIRQALGRARGGAGRCHDVQTSVVGLTCNKKPIQCRQREIERLKKN